MALIGFAFGLGGAVSSLIFLAILFTGVVPYTIATEAGVIDRPAMYVSYDGATLRLYVNGAVRATDATAAYVANRQTVINQAKAQWAAGSLVALTWHLCPPTGGPSMTPPWNATVIRPWALPAASSPAPTRSQQASGSARSCRWRRTWSSLGRLSSA